MYPDEFQGYYNYSLTSWRQSYRQDEALEFLRPATEVQQSAAPFGLLPRRASCN